MTNKKLINFLLYGYGSTLRQETFQSIREKLLEAEIANKDKDVAHFANEISKNLPYFDILHQNYIRHYVAKINTSINVIKVIVVIGFILAIIGVLANLFG